MGEKSLKIQGIPIGTVLCLIDLEVRLISIFQSRRPKKVGVKCFERICLYNLKVETHFLSTE